MFSGQGVDHDAGGEFQKLPQPLSSEQLPARLEGLAPCHQESQEEFWVPKKAPFLEFSDLENPAKVVKAIS